MGSSNRESRSEADTPAQRPALLVHGGREPDAASRKAIALPTSIPCITALQRAAMQPSERRRGPIRFDRRRSPQCRVRYPGLLLAWGVGNRRRRLPLAKRRKRTGTAAAGCRRRTCARAAAGAAHSPSASGSASGRRPIAAAGQQRRVDHRHADRIVRARSVRAVFLSGRPGAPLRCHDRQPSPQNGGRAADARQAGTGKLRRQRQRKGHRDRRRERAALSPLRAGHGGRGSQATRRRLRSPVSVVPDRVPGARLSARLFQRSAGTSHRRSAGGARSLRRPASRSPRCSTSSPRQISRNARPDRK